MQKFSSYTIKIDGDKVLVFNFDSHRVEELNRKRHKAASYYPIVTTPGESVYERRAGRKFYNDVTLINPTTPDCERILVIEQTKDGIRGVISTGDYYNFPNSSIQNLVNKGKISGLRLINGAIAIDGDVKASHFHISVPDRLKDVVNDRWEVLGEIEEDTKISDDVTSAGANMLESMGAPDIENIEVIIDKSENNQSNKNPIAVDNISVGSVVVVEQVNTDLSAEDKLELAVKQRVEEQLEAERAKFEEAKKSEEVYDIHYQIDDINKHDSIGEMSYVGLYKAMVNNTRVGDIISIPNCILPDLRVEYIRIIAGSFAGSKQTVIARLKTDEGPSFAVVGVLAINAENSHCTFQVMNKPLDPNNKTIGDIEVEYYKWKQSRKYIQA